jgi:hypothetical protein
MNLTSTMIELLNKVTVHHLLALYVICVLGVIVKLYWGSRR